MAGSPARNRVKFRKILAPTDFSEASKAGLEMARDLAEISDGEIFLLFIEEPVWDQNLAEEIKNILQDYNKALHQHAENTLKEMTTQGTLANVRASVLIGEGHAVESILRVAEEKKVDLICMATRGWGNQEPSGSITERVVRNSPVPVLVVPCPCKLEGSKIRRPMGVEEE